MSNLPALKKRLNDFIEEYEIKRNNLDEALKNFENAGKDIQTACCIGGTYGNTHLDTGRIYKHTMETALKKSAWKHAYNYCNIDIIGSAKDKNLFEQSLENPPEFTLDNVLATFGDYVVDPFGNILRGLAEVFCDLDPAYKSHDKVKIGVKGLPKRIIITNLNSYGWGQEKLKNVLNALAAYQGKPLLTYSEIQKLMKEEEDGLLKSWTNESGDFLPARGVRLKRFSNGNGHLFFEPDTLKDINMALSQYYGEVLPDCSEDAPTEKRESTAVSKDLQYYPTPKNVVKYVLDDVYIQKGDKILEPSCGCGRFMDALRDMGAEVFGIEIDAGRVNICRENGHNVLCANFLEVEPQEIYDAVIMNSPFYGTHYFKHVKHALKFVKDGGYVLAILPVTARLDHGLVDGLPNKKQWGDLPFGSFKESGTNINTVFVKIWK